MLTPGKYHSSIIAARIRRTKNTHTIGSVVSQGYPRSPRISRCPRTPRFTLSRFRSSSLFFIPRENVRRVTRILFPVSVSSLFFTNYPLFFLSLSLSLSRARRDLPNVTCVHGCWRMCTVLVYASVITTWSSCTSRSRENRVAVRACARARSSDL